MAARTISTGEDIDSALAFLGGKKSQSAEDYFQSLIAEVVETALKRADEERFALAKQLMNDGDKSGSLAKLRNLLAV